MIVKIELIEHRIDTIHVLLQQTQILMLVLLALRQLLQGLVHV